MDIIFAFYPDTMQIFTLGQDSGKWFTNTPITRLEAILDKDIRILQKPQLKKPNSQIIFTDTIDGGEFSSKIVKLTQYPFDPISAVALLTGEMPDYI